ncbi:hypothetical protein H5410_021755 [Solanum commersonii]|uniref:Uncharacterized protein n=1 Tax=Solanum commersonii TaxID=4109 RepID=A0A9J5ZCU8_SOLCO|nr:hypothetical protein H5410_021755 [Solanum commersonii]
MSGHIILEYNRCPSTHHIKHNSYHEVYVSQAMITPLSSLYPKTLQKIIQDSIAATPEAILSALTVAYPDKNLNKNSKI